MKTIFEKIIDNALPSEKVLENERLVAIKDIAPIAPVHILIIPKKHFSNLTQVTKQDEALLSEVMLVAIQLAKQFNIEDGFRLLTNNGSSAGQTVFHLHFHLIGGRSLGPMG